LNLSGAPSSKRSEANRVEEKGGNRYRQLRPTATSVNTLSNLIMALMCSAIRLVTLG